MKQKYFIAILLLLSLVAPFAALADSFYLKPADLELGKTETLQFYLDNTNACYGFQAEVKLPAGIQAVKVTGSESEKFDITLSERASDGKYEVESNILSNGNLIMGAYSANNTPFSGNSGVLVYLKVSVSESFKGGTVQVSNVMLIDKDDKDVELVSTSAKLGVKVTSVTLSEAVATLKVGQSVTLEATVAPESATDQTIVWTSNDKSIATVDAEGKVTAIAIGDATITATCGTVSADCKVTVEATPVESVTFTRKTLTIKEGDKITLTPNFNPTNATDKSVTWASSDESVATVSAKGEVTAVKKGTANITATSSNGKTATCVVTVSDNIIHVTSISISKTELNLTEGDKSTLTATVAPDDATDKSVEWSSDNEEVATVSENGEVTAVKAGSATITATSFDGKTATCKVTVAAKIIAATGVTLSETTANLMVGGTLTLKATVAPENATDKTVTWKSSNEEIATVDAKGKVTAKALGETAITATCGTVSATCKVTVIPTPVETVALSKTELKLTEGDKATLTATVEPEDATDKTVTWTSSDTAVATVSAAGEVTAVKAGSATITATSSNGKTATCTVTVAAKVIAATGVTLSKTSAQLKVGESVTLTATVAPENTTDKTVTWTSSNIEVATVVDGKITAIALGETTISATCGKVKASCKVTVVATPVESVKLNATTADMKAGETLTLTATVAPDKATDKTLEWTSSDEKVATVDQNGKVTAVAGGTATITAASTAYPTIKAECKVTVIVPVTGLVIKDQDLNDLADGATIDIHTGDKYNLTAVVSPENATDNTVEWTSSNLEVITFLDAEGLLHAEKAGESTITAKIADFTRTVLVKVTDPVIKVESVTLSQNTAEMLTGDSLKLTAKVLPEDATSKKVAWSSSDKSIATVTNGLVKALKAGTVTIKALAGNFADSCKITIKNPIIAVSEIILDRTEVKDLVEGETVKLTATVSPENATDPTVTWTSSNEKIAKVDAQGTVTAVAPGTATITAKAGEKTATCEVTVVAKYIVVEGLAILDEDDNDLDSTHSLALHTGDEYTLTEVVTPENATEQKVTWTSSDEAVAEIVDIVEEPHQVHINAVAAGEATITATLGDLSISFKVTVTDPVIPITGIKLNMASAEMLTGETIQLTATIEPEDASSKEVKWTSNDNTIATVSAKGVVKALKAGKVTITATANKLTANCEITITDPYIAVDEIALNKHAITLVEGEATTLTATVTPENATDKTVTWTSSDAAVATVDAEGNVKAVAPGTATITAKAGEKTATCVVTVKAAVIDVDGITLDKEDATLVEGETLTLTATVSPKDATDQTVTWSSSNEAIATVDENGVVTAVAAGEVTITATAGDKTAECKLTVKGATVGVDMIGFDGNAPIKVYDLNGRYVSDNAENLATGFYIFRQGNKAKKVRVK